MPAAHPPEIDWLDVWSLPQESPAKVALGVGLLLLFFALLPRGPRFLARTSWLEAAGIPDGRRRRRFLATAAAAAAFLSLGYIAYYLRAGPRAAEAAVYWLQGRGISRGHLSWEPPGGIASFAGRGVAVLASGRLAPHVAPGFSLLLALGFAVGAPMVVGPLLAGGLVVATWFLGSEMAAIAGLRADRVESTGRLAAGLSIMCAALRYHTADPLPHALAGGLVACALALVLRARRRPHSAPLALCGLALGGVAVVHPLSSVAATAVCLSIAARGPVAGARTETAASAQTFAGRRLGIVIAGTLPGLVVLALAHHFGAGLSLVDSVILPDAAPPVLALTPPSSKPPIEHLPWLLPWLHALRAHLADVASFEPLPLVAVFALVGKYRAKGARPAALIVAGHAIVCAIAGQTGVGMGAGAAGLAAVLPVDHALVALALARLFPRSIGRAAIAAMGFVAVGFALHGARGHEALAASEPGRPRFEPDLLREHAVTAGILLFDDDVGYEIASDPGAVPSRALVAARFRGDDYDRLVYDALGHPAVHRYDPTPKTGPTLTPWTPPGEGNESWRFEAESEWPPASVAGGDADDLPTPGSCASGALGSSGGKVLQLTPRRRVGGDVEAQATIELPSPRLAGAVEKRTWQVAPRVFQNGSGGEGTIDVRRALGSAAGPPLAHWAWVDHATQPTCVELPPQPLELGPAQPRAWLVLTARHAAVAFDRTVVRSR
jgi:hypothetical protein